MNLPGLFVVGTDTGVGKTAVTAGILRGLREANRRVGAVKPISTSGMLVDGLLVSPDALILAKALDPTTPLERICPLVFAGDVAPSVAIRLAGSPLRLASVLAETIRVLSWWEARCEVVVVEGVGGLLCPITPDATVADLAIALDFPLVIVARRGLGTLNHTLLTAEAAKSRGLRIAGVIFNGSEPDSHDLAEQSNPEELAARLSGVAILGEIRHEVADPSGGVGLLGVNWYDLAKPSRMAASPPS